MKKKENAAMLVLIAVLLLVAAGLLFVALNYHILDFKLYPKNAQVLDLTDQDISLEHYEKLTARMPDCEIHWNVPFQGRRLPEDTAEVAVTQLAKSDARALSYLPELKRVQAKDCRDYENLLYLQEQLPEVAVDYQVPVSGVCYGPDTEVVAVDSVTREEILSLQYLPKLTRVVACAGQEPSDYTPLRNFCLNTGLEFVLRLGGQEIPYETAQLTVEGMTEEEVSLLQYIKGLESLHLVNPGAEPETLLALRQQYPNTAITWEVELAGKRYPDTTTEVDLSQLVVEDLAQVERAMGYFPDAQLLTLGLCGIDDPSWGNSKMDGKLAVSLIDNEDLAAFRDRVKDRYKVVWTVRLGPHIALRTDADNFMPNHFGVGRLPDDYAHNLRYCIDMVCLDLGHMTVTHIDFVQYMPKLKYLILAWSNVKYIEPIRNCKELIFLELDNSAIRDLSPLADCTKLEDLNIGNAWPNVDGILGMTWLKNVYMIFGSKSDAWKISPSSAKKK